LTPDEWHLQTVSSQRTVKDIASHLLDESLRRLSMQRNNYRLVSDDSSTILDRHLGRTCLDIFMRLLTYTFRDAEAPVGSAVAVSISESGRQLVCRTSGKGLAAGS
jgi:hypothetical protein